MPPTYVDSARALAHAYRMAQKPPPSHRQEGGNEARAILGRNLKALMDLHDWNQVELARRSGVSQRHISDILRLRTDATAIVIDRLAKAFGRAGYELQIDGLHEAVSNSSSNLNELVSSYVKDPAVRRLLDAALGLTPKPKR